MPYKNKEDALKNAKIYRTKNAEKIKAYLLGWRERNPEYMENYLSADNRYTRRLGVFKIAINEARKDGCVDCGEKDPCCLDFDHRDPESKSFGISKAMYRSLEDLLAEIAKCDVRCANCHRKRTAKMQHWRRRDTPGSRSWPPVT